MTVSTNFRGWRFNHQWSAWSHGERRAQQSICYSGLFYAPNEYMDKNVKDQPVSYHFGRFCKIELADWWLAFCVNDLFPDYIRYNLEIIPFESDDKSVWEKFKGTEGFSRFKVRESDYRGFLVGGEPGLFLADKISPWLTVQLPTDINHMAHFAVANFLRYPTEHTPVPAVAHWLVTEAKVNWSPSMVFAFSQWVTHQTNHVVGDHAFLSDDSELTVRLSQYDVKKCFHRLKRFASMMEFEEKVANLDDYFTANPTRRRGWYAARISAKSISIRNTSVRL